MEKVCDYEQCTGCGLCASNCPKGCIKMTKRDSFGHLYPIINVSDCIDCGLCQKNCPIVNPSEQIEPSIAYAAWSKDEEDYKSSASGGAASAISQYVIENGGVVYGCAMLPDIEVKHIRVDNLSNINKLKGSKYVQSSMEGVYLQLKEDVNSGRMTLFIGTPCQAAAVKKLFKVQPNNLIIVDLICHGVPSVEILKKHIKKVAHYPHCSNVIFRDGYYVCLKVEVDGEIVYSRRHIPSPRRYDEWYLDTFLDGYTYRGSCYNCKFACLKRVSDITIGDFWGLGKEISAAYIPSRPFGCSVILPSTKCGQRVVEKLSLKMNLYERTVKEAAKGNGQLNWPTTLSRRKKWFRKLFPVMGSSAYRLVTMDKFIKRRVIPSWLLSFVKHLLYHQ